jgi:ammonia channel protein AmtB
MSYLYFCSRRIIVSKRRGFYVAARSGLVAGLVAVTAGSNLMDVGYELDNGTDSELKAFAQQTLPKI